MDVGKAKDIWKWSVTDTGLNRVIFIDGNDRRGGYVVKAWYRKVRQRGTYSVCLMRMPSNIF